jgi:hypothetical protein
MADSNLFGVLYERLTGPIRERPFSSFIFFAALLGVGAWLTRWFQGKPELWQQALVTVLLVLPSVGIILCLHRLLVMRDQPPSLKDPGVLEGIKKSFVGRAEDAEALIVLILASRQVWLNGDSGVGKSMLLQKAVLPEFEQKKIAAIYLSSWRGDWEEAPAKAILTRLSAAAASRETLLPSLRAVLDSADGLVIFLDQFDEFQIEHRDRLILERGQVITRAQLEEQNAFFRILNEATRLGRVRCVFVSRRDVEWGKRVVLLEDAEELFLKRLPKSVVEAEIGRVIPAETVADAGNGWDELREQLCNDLGDDGILPVQMRFAVLGLEELRHNLTRPAYFRIGRVNGLISHYIEREVRRVAGDRSLAVILFPLLNQMVSADGQSTVAVGQAELLRTVPKDSTGRVLKALEELERRDIVRRVLSQEGSVLWRLDHDYLAGPVNEVVRRQLPEQAELKDRYEHYLACPGWQRPLRLAGPFTVTRLMRARLFRGLQLGPAVSWLLFSISALLAISAGIVYESFDVAARIRGQEEGRRLFSVFGEDRATSPEEAAALLQLANADMFTRRAFLETALQSSENARRLMSHQHGIAVALSHMDTTDSRRLFEIINSRHEIEKMMDGPDPSDSSRFFERLLQTEGGLESDLAVVVVASQLQQFWAGKSVLSTRASERLIRTICQRMSDETSTTVLHQLASELQALKDTEFQPASIEAAVVTLSLRMTKEKDAAVLHELAFGLSALQRKVSPLAIEAAISALSAHVTTERDSHALGELAAGLGLLRRERDSEVIAAAAARLTRQMDAERSPRAVDDLISGLRALGKGRPLEEELVRDKLAAAWRAQNRMLPEVASDRHTLLPKWDQETSGHLINRTQIWEFEWPRRVTPVADCIWEGTFQESPWLAHPRDPEPGDAAADQKGRLRLADQLANPLCSEGSWRLSALDAAKMTGRQIARGDKDKPDEIVVDFAEVCAFIASERPGPGRFPLGLPTIASLLLLLGAVVSCVFAVAKLPRGSLPASALSQA